MDYIMDLARDQRAELQARLAQYETSILIMSHNGNVPSIAGFNVARVTTVIDIVKLELPAVAVLGDDAADLAYIIGARPTAIGLNIFRVVDVPDQDPSAIVNAEIGALAEISMVRVLNDLADDELVRRNMTQTELEHSETKKQEAQRFRKDGTVKPLIEYDFDGKVSDDEVD